MEEWKKFSCCASPKMSPNVDGWLVVKACYVLRLQTQVKPGTRILYYCIVKLFYVQGKHKESRSYGLTDCACKAVVFEACTIECHAFRRHP